MFFGIKSIHNHFHTVGWLVLSRFSHIMMFPHISHIHCATYDGTERKDLISHFILLENPSNHFNCITSINNLKLLSTIWANGQTYVQISKLVCKEYAPHN